MAPVLVDEPILRIKAGRHPVLERLPNQPSFVPNDLYLKGDERQILVITGPNMAGKSTYIRQAGLIVLMAQMGSFVPATAATIGIVDRIFTRIGAADVLTRGMSTFMVEMSETARILNACTDRSLVILDEVGRGTSTYDGISIASAIVEFLHEVPEQRALALFATHYHELSEMADQLPRVHNMNVQVKEWGERVVFLYTVLPGPADHSYGIQVARLAGIPERVLKRAKEVLRALESDAGQKARAPRRQDSLQLSLFSPPAEEHPIQAVLRGLDPNAITPLEALKILQEWKEKWGDPHAR